MHLYCKTCGEPIDADDVNIKLAIAKCRSCNAVFGFAEQLAGQEARKARRNRDDVPMPKAITVDPWGHDLTITRRWFSWIHVFLVFFCIAWDSFLVFWYFMAFTEKSPLIFKIFPIFHLATGVGLTYFTIAGFLNRTVIKVASGILSVRHTPLPWPGNHRIETAGLDQIYCTEEIRHGEDNASFNYVVNAKLTDGRKVKLLTGLDEPDQALFIEQQIERHLGIEDRPVRGEMQ
ncbi:MAG: hypothetical protein JXQ73_17875 [Phycisphaerae bacterium]|nr:hypothetical protein [Phycisphaerae bacterium]